MEALGLVVSIVALVESSYKLCDFVSDVKDGGKERMKLLKEVSNLCCTLDNLKERVDTSETEQTALLRILDKKDGPIHQCTEIVDNLTKKLTSSEVRVGRLVQRLKWNFDKREVLEAVEQLHRIQATITQALQQVIYTVVGQMQTTTTRTLGFIEERQSKDIRDWLSPLNFAAQQEVVFEDHCVGTGRIILQSSGFAAFKELTKSVMWCRGPPGAGKTYQASIIAQHLVQGDASTGERCPVLVVYCRYDDPACQVLTNILGDLVRQCLVSPYIPDKLSALYKRHISSDTRPTCKELVEILAEQIGTSKHCRIVLDALDEFGTSSDRALLLQALASINATLESGSHLNNATQSHSNEPGGVSLLITSRHVQDIDAALRAVWLHDEKGSLSRDEYRYKTYELSPSTEDIRRYLDWRIGKEFTLKMMTTQRTELNKMIAVSIIEASGSLFLLAKLMVDAISSCLTVRELKKSLQMMPAGLTVAYKSSIDRVHRQGPGRSRRAFEVMKWVMFARRPLSSAEMEHAVSIDIGSGDIDVEDLISADNLAALCAGLVVIDQYDTFRFAHQTVSEYLNTNHADDFQGQRKSVADSCMTYLMYDTFAAGPCDNSLDFQHRLLNYPLYTYCSQHWYKQLNNGPTPGQKILALAFFGSEPHWRSSRQSARSGQSGGGKLLPHARLWGDAMLHHAAYLDAHHIFEDLYDLDRSALNKRNELGRTPLMRAAVSRSSRFAIKLMDAGADVNLRDKAGHAAIHLAIWARDIQTVDAILSKPSVETGVLVVTGSGLQTALSWAAENGDIEIVCSLICYGADITTVSEKHLLSLRPGTVTEVRHTLAMTDTATSTARTTIRHDIEDMLLCFDEYPPGDYAACEAKLRHSQELVGDEAAPDAMLQQAVQYLRNKMDLEARKLTQLSLFLRRYQQERTAAPQKLVSRLESGQKDALPNMLMDYQITIRFLDGVSRRLSKTYDSDITSLRAAHVEASRRPRTSSDWPSVVSIPSPPVSLPQTPSLSPCTRITTSPEDLILFPCLYSPDAELE